MHPNLCNLWTCWGLLYFISMMLSGWWFAHLSLGGESCYSKLSKRWSRQKPSSLCYIYQRSISQCITTGSSNFIVSNSCRFDFSSCLWWLESTGMRFAGLYLCQADPVWPLYRWDFRFTRKAIVSTSDIFLFAAWRHRCIDIEWFSGNFSATEYQNHSEPIGALLLGLWEFNNPKSAKSAKSAKSLGCSATLFQACGTVERQRWCPVVAILMNACWIWMRLCTVWIGWRNMVGLDHEDERILFPRRHLWLCYLCLHIFTYLCKALCYQLYTSLVPKPCKELSNGPPFSAESQWDRAAAPALQARPSTNAMPRHVVMLNWWEIVPKSGAFWKSNADKCRIKWSKFLQDRREIPKPDWNCSKLVNEFSWYSQFPVLSWMCLESLKFAVPAFCQGPVRCSVLQIFPRRRRVQRYPEEAIAGQTFTALDRCEMPTCSHRETYTVKSIQRSKHSSVRPVRLYPRQTDRSAFGS